MVQRLIELRRPWKLHYFARSRSHAAFLRGLENLAGASRDCVRLRFDSDAGGSPPDLASVVNGSTTDSHFYCCGPAPMIAAFGEAAASIPRECVHVEHFSPSEPTATAGGFTVILARSGRRIAVSAGKTILQALLDDGVQVPHSCMEGTCGSCETGVISGRPDHRDSILTEDERGRSDSMMICCSGCLDEELVLDL
jgi:vanillate O-demethylase ferredoxin subunit